MAKSRHKLRRHPQLDRDHAWLLGVCAGLANYWRIDPAIVRVGIVLGGLFIAKLTIATYLIAWLMFNNRSNDGADLDTMN